MDPLVQAIMSTYETLSSVPGPPSEAFKSWLQNYKHMSTYHRFLHWCLVDWYDKEGMMATTFIDVGVVTVDVLEALVKGLQNGRVRVNEWLQLLTPRVSPVQVATQVAQMLYHKQLVTQVDVNEAEYWTDNEWLQRDKRLLPWFNGEPPHWWGANYSRRFSQ